MCLKKLIKLLEEKPALPSFETFPVKVSAVKEMLESHGIECMLKDKYVLADYDFHYIKEEDWLIALPYLTYPANFYVAELDIDCDDYSRWGSSDCSKLFKVNANLQCWGDTPYGYHAFSLALTGANSFKIFEPNAGFPCAGQLMNKDNEYGWLPKSWK